MKLLDKLLEARAAHRAEHVEKEKTKLGVLRAGSTGIISETGETAGACPRTSLLRSKGIEVDPPTPDKYIMFELGYANEDVILKQLQETVGKMPGYGILKEEEVPISWKTNNGTLVTGRPDLVITKNGKPTIGIELKSVHSLWTAREVVFNRKPKLVNMAQAAHYMWKLGVPEYKLMYKSYSQLGQGMAGNDWIIKQFPRPGEPGSEFIDYTVSAKHEGKYTIKHIKQFEIVYDLSFDKSGRLRYREEGHTKWIPTVISQKSIEDYFELVSKMEETGEMGPRPSAVDIHGDKENYTQCKYCPLNDICDSYQKKGYDKWMEQVLKFTGQSNKSKVSSKKSR